MKSITLNHVKKAYGKTVIMEDMHFKVNPGERLVLLGPSGCGKSTILRMIAGFEEVTDGELKFDDQVVNDVKAGDRNVAMVFQNYALYPHMTVTENILYGLKVNKVPEARMKERFDEVVEALNLEKYLDRKPAELSGGQRQRVALARATVKDSDIFLLDEPLSNLDAQLRVSARESLVNIHERYGQTMIYVTHDQIEAMTFGDRIALLNFGDLQMLDTPENIYNKPANIFTARFIGNPPMNVPESSDYKDGRIYIGTDSIAINHNWIDYINRTNKDNLNWGIRPEHIHISTTPLDNAFIGEVINVENQGPNYANFIEIGGERITAVTDTNITKPGEQVYVTVENNKLSFFDKVTTQNIGYPEDIEEELLIAAGKFEVQHNII